MKPSLSFILGILFICFHGTYFAQNISLKQDEKSGLYGFVDNEDKYIINPIYKEVDYSFGSKPGLYKVVDNNDKVGYVNEEGKEIVACKYDEASSFEKGYAVVKIKIAEFTYKHGLIDSMGNEIIPVKYGVMEYYPNGQVLLVGEDNAAKVGVMNLHGEWIISPQYEFWSKRISKGIWPVGRRDTCGVVNMKNETVVPFIYEMIECYSEELDVAPAKKGGKYGFIDRKGNVVIPFIYEDAWPSGPYLAVKKDKKWGIINKENTVILPIEYASISTVNAKTAWVSKEENESAFEVDLATKQKVKK